MNINEFTNPQQQQIPYTDEDYAFVSKVLDKITNGHKLPLNIESTDVLFAIANNAAEYYDICPWATVDDRVIAKLDMMNRPVREFIPDYDANNPDSLNTQTWEIANDTIIVPGVVEEVFEVRWFQRGYGYIGSFNYSAWKLEAMLTGGVMNAYHNMIGSDTYMGSVYINNTLKSMSIETVHYDFNSLTKELKIYDDNKRTGFIEMYVARRIPLVKLYTDRWFMDFITALTIIANCEKIKMFDAKLPGDLNLNVDEIKTRGTELLTKVREYLEQETEHTFNFIKH